MTRHNKQKLPFFAHFSMGYVMAPIDNARVSKLLDFENVHIIQRSVAKKRKVFVLIFQIKNDISLQAYLVKAHLDKIVPILSSNHFGSEIPDILMLSKFLKNSFGQNWYEIEFPPFWIQNLNILMLSKFMKNPSLRCLFL